MPTIRLFHGTAHEFSAFSDNFAERGDEANSGLGIHLTEHPGLAIDYAELATRDGGASNARVLIVEVEVSRMALVGDVLEFLGYHPEFFDPETNIPREEYVAARLKLEAAGYDGVAMDECWMDDLTGTWVMFDPSKLRIVGSLTVDEAMDAERSDFEGVLFEPVKLFAEEMTANLEPCC